MKICRPHFISLQKEHEIEHKPKTIVILRYHPQKMIKLFFKSKDL